MPTFADFLNEYMGRTGIPDAELARRMGISRLTLIRWKEGVTTRPRHRDDVLRCAQVLRLMPQERNEFALTPVFGREVLVELQKPTGHDNWSLSPTGVGS